ncbi:PREDICTED: peritrophin-48-like [Bactrocera latifrons]|uniref:Chitin-binding type-2 domain-containing protein n=1 Tax=Bactrocera latifrons TaxID=174628 RepID=A0A0K8UAM2_BACLA|nr:PREDICTED: peritrophin-48-like [Bactrocera latifrons]
MSSRRWYHELTAFLICSFVIGVYNDTYEACENKPNYAFITSNTSCRHYIYCAGDESYEGECADGDYFNELLQTCDPEQLVTCQLYNTSSPNPSSMQTAPTQAAMNTTASSTFSSTVIASSTSAPIQITTSQTNSDNTSTTSALSESIATSVAPPVTEGAIAIIISTECPLTDNPNQMIFVPHPKTCSDYFICFRGQQMAMHCSSMLHFNSNTGKCDYAENVRCQTVFSNPREQCQLHTTDLYPHETNCNYFYSCRNGYLLLQQCPFKYGWDFERRACTALQQASCYNRRIMQ